MIECYGKIFGKKLQKKVTVKKTLTKNNKGIIEFTDDAFVHNFILDFISPISSFG